MYVSVYCYYYKKKKKNGHSCSLGNKNILYQWSISSGDYKIKTTVIPDSRPVNNRARFSNDPDGLLLPQDLWDPLLPGRCVNNVADDLNTVRI